MNDQAAAASDQPIGAAFALVLGIVVLDAAWEFVRTGTAPRGENRVVRGEDPDYWMITGLTSVLGMALLAAGLVAFISRLRSGLPEISPRLALSLAWSALILASYRTGGQSDDRGPSPFARARSCLSAGTLALAPFLLLASIALFAMFETAPKVAKPVAELRFAIEEHGIWYVSQRVATLHHWAELLLFMGMMPLLAAAVSGWRAQRRTRRIRP